MITFRFLLFALHPVYRSIKAFAQYCWCYICLYICSHIFWSFHSVFIFILYILNVFKYILMVNKQQTHSFTPACHSTLSPAQTGVIDRLAANHSLCLPRGVACVPRGRGLWRSAAAFVSSFSSSLRLLLKFEPKQSEISRETEAQLRTFLRCWFILSYLCLFIHLSVRVSGAPLQPPHRLFPAGQSAAHCSSLGLGRSRAPLLSPGGKQQGGEKAPGKGWIKGWKWASSGREVRGEKSSSWRTSRLFFFLFKTFLIQFFGLHLGKFLLHVKSFWIHLFRKTLQIYFLIFGLFGIQWGARGRLRASPADVSDR